MYVMPRGVGAFTDPAEVTRRPSRHRAGVPGTVQVAADSVQGVRVILDAHPR
jgi:hypothetical protein